MEEIIQAAKATYDKLPEEEKKEIVKLFKSMDRDGDGEISVQEFKTYFERKGDDAKANSNLFKLTDRNGDGNLQFDEVLTLFYISESGRPVCDGCGNFIQGLFFTCRDCHYSRPAEDGYNICTACYKTGGFVHDHTEFLDNYTLFAEMKKNNGEESARIRINSSLSSSGTLSSTGIMSSSGTLSSRGINQQRRRKRDIFKRGFKAFIQIVPGATAIGAIAAVDPLSNTDNNTDDPANETEEYE